MGRREAYNSATTRLMACIDDARRHPGLILIAATNFYDGLDRPLIREGRFDLHIRLDLPNEEERTRIFEAQLAKRPSKHFDSPAVREENTRMERGQNRHARGPRCFLCRRRTEKDRRTRPGASFSGRRAGRTEPHSKRWTGRMSFCRPIQRQISGTWCRLMDPAYGERLKLAMPTGLLLIGPLEPARR